MQHFPDVFYPLRWEAARRSLGTKRQEYDWGNRFANPFKEVPEPRPTNLGLRSAIAYT